MGKKWNNFKRQNECFIVFCTSASKKELELSQKTQPDTKLGLSHQTNKKAIRYRE